MMPAPDRLIRGDEVPHASTNGMCRERQNSYNWIHCWTHGVDEPVRFGQGFVKAVEVCSYCFHAFRDVEALEQAYLDQMGEKRPAAEITDCPFCLERFTSQGNKR